MKNIIALSPRSSHRGRLNISQPSDSNDCTRKLSSGSDTLEDYNITLKSFKINEDIFDKKHEQKEETKQYSGFEKIIHDVNSNNLSSYTKPSTLKRFKTWNKGFTRKLREFEENLPETDTLKQTIRQVVNNSNNSRRHSRKSSEGWQGIGYNKDDRWKGVGYNVKDQWKGVGFTVSENTSATLPSRRKTVSGDLKHRIVTEPLRKLSNSTSALRKTSDSSSHRSPDLERKENDSSDIIDFGACYSPDEMKSWGIVIEKLAAKMRHTNNITHRRYTSLSETLGTLREPAKKILTHSLPGSVKRRRKSYECRRSQSEYRSSRNTEHELNSSEEDVRDCSPPDLSLSRELMEELFLNSSTFSANVWYHGCLDIRYEKHMMEDTHFEDNGEGEISLNGSILARVDRFGDVVYSITYKFNDTIRIGTFPLQDERYCLDFSDAEQPRFISVKYLIAYLIEQKYMERVTFSWLIDHCDLLMADF